MSEAPKHVNGEPPIDQTPDFQQQATGADAGVTALFLRFQELGIAPEAIASGAMFALCRYHLGMLPEPVTQRHLISVMLPALQRTADDLIKRG